MMLSDGTIRQLVEAGEVHVSPAPEDHQYQPVSLDLHLGNNYRRVDGSDRNAIYTNEMVLRPGEFILAETREMFVMPHHIAGLVHGKSTWARRGLLVHAAGLVDPGFRGTITLELRNLCHLPIRLSAGYIICQMSFELTDCAVVRPYGTPSLRNHYQGQTGATPAAEG